MEVKETLICHIHSDCPQWGENLIFSIEFYRENMDQCVLTIQVCSTHYQSHHHRHFVIVTPTIEILIIVTSSSSVVLRTHHHPHGRRPLPPPHLVKVDFFSPRPSLFYVSLLLFSVPNGLLEPFPPVHLPLISLSFSRRFFAVLTLIGGDETAQSSI